MSESIDLNAGHEVYAGALAKSVTRVESGLDKMYFGELERKSTKAGTNGEEEDNPFTRAFYGSITKQLNEVQLSAIRAVSV